MLLHHGADPDIQNQLNETALHAAVHPNNIYWNKEAEDVALALIDGGADANVAGQYENTPLHYAVKSNMHRVIRALVEHGASLEAADTFFGGMPIHVAAIDLGPRPVHSGAGWSPTIRTSPETLAMLSLLVELGSDVDAQLHEGSQTPLHNACFYENVNIARYLLEQGADPTIQDYKGRTALHTDDPELIALFKEFGFEAIADEELAHPQVKYGMMSP